MQIVSYFSLPPLALGNAAVQVSYMRDSDFGGGLELFYAYHDKPSYQLI